MTHQKRGDTDTDYGGKCSWPGILASILGGVIGILLQVMLIVVLKMCLLDANSLPLQ
jgi:hypothetical protein